MFHGPVYLCLRFHPRESRTSKTKKLLGFVLAIVVNRLASLMGGRRNRVHDVCVDRCRYLLTAAKLLQFLELVHCLIELAVDHAVVPH